MKKLMIVAAVALTAAVSQAMAITWGTGGLKMVDADGKWTSTSAYTGKTAGDLTSLAITAYLYDATGKTLLGTGTGDLSDIKNAGSAVSSKSFYDSEKAVVTVDASTDYMVKLVMTGDFGNGDVQTFLNTDAVAFKSPANGSAAPSFVTLKVIDTTKTQWSAVPEPTSGLLLLLGVAGLALKRKRA